MKKSFNKIIAGILLIALMSSISVMFVGCKKEEEIPWYKDKANIEWCFEEYRLVGERVILQYKPYYEEKIELTMVINKNNMDDKEYMPDIKILYKGEEQEVFFYLDKAYIPFDGTKLDFDAARPIYNILRTGYYSVRVDCYLTEEGRDHAKYEDYLWRQYIYINVILEGDHIQ